jgi:hypothetical protein
MERIRSEVSAFLHSTTQFQLSVVRTWLLTSRLLHKNEDPQKPKFRLTDSELKTQLKMFTPISDNLLAAELGNASNGKRYASSRKNAGGRLFSSARPSESTARTTRADLTRSSCEDSIPHMTALMPRILISKLTRADDLGLDLNSLL